MTSDPTMQTEKAKDHDCTAFLLGATDNAKYVSRGRGLAASYDPGWEDDLAEASDVAANV